MASHESLRTPSPTPPRLDLVKVLRVSGILSDRQCDEIRARVLSGDLPFDAEELAQRLIRDQVLTGYQASRLLKNKPHGMALGKYVLLDKIGSGSMGRVYLARHQLMNRQVAIKIVAPEISSNKRVVARFQREMKLVGRLDHPNVVRAFDADRLGDALYIVMEYVPGKSLGQLMKQRGRLPATAVARQAAQAALGLGHAHAQGVVHRDVKPSNILVGEDGRVRVLDLGLGVLLESDAEGSFATADNIAVGTIDYMSPEQAMGRQVDGRSDLYSLGCTMYHVISGQRPFPADSDVERLGKRLNSTPVPLADKVPGLPPGLSEVMDRLIAIKPQDRFHTAEEAAEALERVGTLAPSRSSANVPASVQGLSAAAAPTAPPVVKVVEKFVEVPVEPDYPTWFRPLARLAVDRPGLLVAAVGAAALAAILLGFALGRAGR
jgi:serine/threonine-protein kinase